MRPCNYSITGATCFCENRLWMCWGQFTSHASISNRMARSTFPGQDESPNLSSKAGSSSTTRALPLSLMRRLRAKSIRKMNGPGVLRQITKRDVLAIAAEVGKAQSLLIPGSTKALPANLFNKTNPVEHPEMMQPKVHQQRRPRALQANSRTRSPRTPDRRPRVDCEQQGCEQQG